MNRHNRLTLWSASVLGTLILLAVGVIHTYYRNSPARWNSFMVGDPHEGATLFFEKKGCARCHAVNGVGASSAPDLGFSRSPQSSLAQIVSTMWNHAPRMWESMRAQGIAYPDLDREDLVNLFAFLYTAHYVDEPGDERRGALLFVSKGCARCHAAQGTANGLAPALADMKGIDTPIVWAQTMWNHAPKMEARMQQLGAAWPKFEDGEMNDLLAYVREVCGGPRRETALLPASPDRGWQVFQDKSCLACHSINGKGGHIGPELGPGRQLPISIVRFAGIMWNHSPQMWRASEARNVPRAAFEGRQLADLVAFLASIRYFEPSGSPQEGATLFVERGCAVCHGPQAEGTRNGPALRGRGKSFTVITIAAALWKDGPKMYQRTRELKVPWPDLTEGDTGNLVSFLNAPVPGRRVQ
ncbi:MAG: cytochrome c [Acidobacteriia bacterium]|nr:cytochrome c [Terriglobia bacterium]